jgi:hypothetical protein
MKIFNTTEEHKQTPDWLTTQITYLLPKSEDTKEPKNYRQITFLSALYKILTGITAWRILSHLGEQSSLPVEQKGCHSGSRMQGSTIDIKAIFEDLVKRRKI